MSRIKSQITRPQTLDEVLSNVFKEIEQKVSPTVVTFNDLWIRPKEGDKLLNLGENLNHMQLSFLKDKLGINPYEKFTLRNQKWIKLKARQLGFTTLIAATFFCDTVNNPLRYSVIMAHDEATTKKIFEIIKRFYDNLPEEKKPSTKYNTKTDLTFDELDSQFYVGTAGSKSFGQGTTVNNVLCSEAASYVDFQSIRSNLFQTVPSSGNIIIESTAEGVGNEFHVEYLAAQDGDSIFKDDFSPWFDDPTYVTQPPDDFIPTQEELELCKLYNLSFDQICWYRDKARELKHELKQEYPCSPEEAFISAGGDFFDGPTLQEYIKTAKTLRVLDVPPIHVLPLLHKEIIRPKRGTLSLYQKPIKGHRYILTADSSAGEEDTKSDFSNVDILDVDTCAQVGTLHGKIEPHILARLLCELGDYYNHALLVPERNNHGHTVINEILNHTKYGKMEPTKWGGLYFHKEYDAATRQHTTKPGLLTTARTKFLIIDALNDLTLNRELAISHSPTLIEMLNFKSLGKGKYGAPPGLKDDRVMSLGIGAFILQNLPKKQVPKPSKVLRKGEFI